MESLILDILAAIRQQGGPLSEHRLEGIIHAHNRGLPPDARHYTKKKLLPYCLRVQAEQPELWAAWRVSPAEQATLTRTLQMKPRRSASGVATITVITKPWPCSGRCLYCPNDLRMPKSYLHAEPACQRAERNFFDPYLQVASRLRALTGMGHPCDKIELIVLGGSWTDYPESYQLWFLRELLRALNAGPGREQEATRRRSAYASAGLTTNAPDLDAFVHAAQQAVDAGTLTYNQAVQRLYGENPAHLSAAGAQSATLDQLLLEQERNQVAAHRVVGLVVETRPDAIDVASLTRLRRYGCTKLQIGIQSLNQEILDQNSRGLKVAQIKRAFALLRLFGFKIHIHFMLNLLGATPEGDITDYRQLVEAPDYLPDEVKLYPCSLVDGTPLMDCWRAGSWHPYDDDELVGVLVADLLATPEYTRVSRMVRDIAAQDIVAGNRRANLRQLVEQVAAQDDKHIREIRYREIGGRQFDPEALQLRELRYDTTVSTEYFLQWVTPEDRIAGFLRLSLPTVFRHAAPCGAGLQYLDPVTSAQNADAQDDKEPAALPIGEGEAMIREVHVYGRETALHQRLKPGRGAQHIGLGRRLIERAQEIARGAGYRRLNVISAIGTREYYRKLDFQDGELYQYLDLEGAAPKGTAPKKVTSEETA